MSLVESRRLPGPVLASVGGSGSGCLGRGGSAQGLYDSLCQSASSVRPSSLSASLFPILHQGNSSFPGVPRPSPQGAPPTPGFYSRLFVVQKDSGAWRPIIDLSTLNMYVAESRFHMETPQSVLRSIRRGDWMISVSPWTSWMRICRSRCTRIHAATSALSSKGCRTSSRCCVSASRLPLRSLQELWLRLRHPPQVRNQDAPIPRRLAHPGLVESRLSSGEGQTPASLRRIGHTDQSQEIVSDTVTDSNIPRNGHSVGSVHGQTHPSPGNQSPPRDRGVPLISESPSVHLASTSGSPVISHSSGERRHAEDAPSAIVPPVPMGLPERPCSYFMESPLQIGPSLVIQSDPRRRRCRSLPSSPRSQLLLGRLRHRMGCPGGGTPDVRALDLKPKGALHQFERDDRRAEGASRVPLPPGREDCSSLLRQYHDSGLSSEIGQHEISDPVRQVQGDPPMGRIPQDYSSPPVHQGDSKQDSRSPQSPQPGDRF